MILGTLPEGVNDYTRKCIPKISAKEGEGHKDYCDNVIIGYDFTSIRTLRDSRRVTLSRPNHTSLIYLSEAL